MHKIPFIDISTFDSPDPLERKRIAREWDEAFRTWGFGMITGHGVSNELMEEIHDAGLKFFDRPMEEKKRFTFPGAPRSQGFVPIGSEVIAATVDKVSPHDVCESLTFSSMHWDDQPSPDEFDRSTHRANLWPTDDRNFRQLVTRYHSELYKLVGKLMRISALALDLEEDYFAKYFDRMTTNLRFVDYPHQTVAPLKGQLRYGAHTDFGGLTILRQDSAPGGLEVLGPDKKWVEVTPRPGTFVVNTGDMIQRWSNDRWLSNVHRVTNPPLNASSSTRRLSVVFFSQPNNDAEICALPSCVEPGKVGKYPPVKAYDHLMAKIRKSIPKDL